MCACLCVVCVKGCEPRVRLSLVEPESVSELEPESEPEPEPESEPGPGSESDPGPGVRTCT